MGFQVRSGGWRRTVDDKTVLNEANTVRVETEVISDSDGKVLHHEIRILPLSEWGAALHVKSMLDQYRKDFLYFRYDGREEGFWEFDKSLSIQIGSSNDSWIHERGEIIHTSGCSGLVTPHSIFITPSLKRKRSFAFEDADKKTCGFECPNFRKSQ